MLKIYPTLLVEGTALYNQYKMGKYVPYDLDTLVELLIRFKESVPPWLRIMRIQREIPKKEIASGANAGNLRQLVLDEMEKRGLRCRCIRCREVGHKPFHEVDFQKLKLERLEYESSGGTRESLSLLKRRTLSTDSSGSGSPRGKNIGKRSPRCHPLS